MKSSHIIWTVIALFCHFGSGMAQSYASMPASLSFQNFRSEDGLSDNWIIHIFQDSRGFIWISTREGLNRFDGASFKKFYASKGTRNFFPSNTIRDVCEYKKDWLLIATDAGIVTMNTVDQEFFSCRNKLLDTSVVYASLFVDRNEIWLALKDGLIQAETVPRERKKTIAIKIVHMMYDRIPGLAPSLIRNRGG